MAFVAEYYQPVKPKGALLVSYLPETTGRDFDEGSRRGSNPTLSPGRVSRSDTFPPPEEGQVT